MVKTSYLKAIKEVHTNYGLSGYFRGVMPPTLIRGFEVGVNRYCYSQAEQFCRRHRHNPIIKKCEVPLTGGFAGFGASFVGQPILLLKARAQTLTGSNYKESFRSYYEMVGKIYKNTGWRGMLAGATPNTIFFTLSFAQFYSAYDYAINQLGCGPALAGLLGGVASWPTFYPVEVVRTVAHTTNMTGGEAARQMFKKVMRKPNNIGNIMWPALGMTMCRAVPRWALTFQVHAWCMHYFRTGGPESG